jgi:hypothetical protein
MCAARRDAGGAVRCGAARIGAGSARRPLPAGERRVRRRAAGQPRAVENEHPSFNVRLDASL